MKQFETFITPLTIEDIPLISVLIPKDSTNYYDCMPYAIGANTYGVFQGFKYFDGEVLILFNTKYQKYWKVYKAYGPDDQTICNRLWDWWLHYKVKTEKDLAVNNLTESQYQILLARSKKEGIKVSKSSCEEDVFNIQDITDLKGGTWAKLRMMVNVFKRQGLNHSVEHISESNIEECRTLLKYWVKQMKDNGAVQLNYRQYEYVLLHHSFEGPDTCSYVHKIEGEPKAIVLMNRISDDCFAQTSSFADRDVKGISEYSIYHAFSEASQRGILYAASGLRMVSTWNFKNKYNPIQPSPVWYKVGLPGEVVKDSLPFFE